MSIDEAHGEAEEKVTTRVVKKHMRIYRSPMPRGMI